MEKDQNINTENQDIEVKEPADDQQNKELKQDATKKIEEVKEITPEEKIKELEDKIARTLAEMENLLTKSSIFKQSIMQNYQLGKNTQQNLAEREVQHTLNRKVHLYKA